MERRITDEGIIAIEMVRSLNADLGIPLGRAAALVRDGRSSDEAFAMRTPSGITLTLPYARIQQRITAALRDALEAAPRVARGRPPARTP